MEKRYQIFISSTFKDLIKERQTAMRAVLEMNNIPAGMELFPASSNDVYSTIQKVIDDTDYYVLILGGCFGSYYGMGVSYTEMEYYYALQKGIPVLPFLFDKPETLPQDKREADPDKWDKFLAFRKKLEQSKNHSPQYWQSVSELERKILISLQAEIGNNKRPGWIRATELDNYKKSITQSVTNISLNQVVKLPELTELILLSFFGPHEDPTNLNAKYLTNKFDIDEFQMKYQLSILTEHKYIDYPRNYKPPYFFITGNGRRYLLERNLIPHN